MSEIKRRPPFLGVAFTNQAGATAVEFALLLGFFLTIVFGILEITRVMYVYNTLQEVTRRAANAAATSDFSNVSKTNSIRYNAIFRSTPGELLLASPVTDAHVRIEYLSLVRQSGGSTTMTPIPSGSLPACPTRNRQICMADPNAANCIRFVRVSVCDTANVDGCDRITYSSFTQLVPFPVRLPTAATIVPAESLGFLPGAVPCA